jgi:hypothetical protein
MLAAARYAGPILTLDYDLYDFRISGAGMVWWLGDGLGHGDLMTATDNFESVNWQTALTAILPAAITAGTWTNPSVTSVKMFAPWDTPLVGIRMMFSQIGAEFRVNPAGTLDAGEPDDVFRTLPVQVRVVVTRGESGDDGRYVGVPIRTIHTSLDATRYITGLILTDTNTISYYDPREASIATTTTDRASIPYKDIHGNAMVRRFEDGRVTHWDDGGTGLGTRPANWSAYDDVRLSEKDLKYALRFTTDWYQFIDKDLNVGDAFWCFDPPIVRDTDYQVHYRGDVIEPMLLRCVEASWPLREGMGVYYRDVDGGYVDLSRWVAWEDTQPVSVTVTEPDFDTPPPVYLATPVG